jgi:large subunit ribosomal protein L21
MYAILEHGGHQYRVTAGDRLLVDRIPAEIGSTVTLEPVLMVVDGESTGVGGSVSGASVTATVIAHRRGRKIRVLTYKPKKRRRRTLGHRSQLTELRVEEVRGSTAAAKPGRAQPKKTTGRAERTLAAKAPEATAEEAATAEAAKPKAARPRATKPKSPAPRRSAGGGGDGP